MAHPVDRFHSAVMVLAGDGSVKQRLIKAFQENLDTLEDEELPEYAKPAFSALKERLSSVAPLNGEGTVCATVRKMSPGEASDCAISVVSMYGEMLKHSDAAAGEPGIAQPFLVKTAS